MRADSGLVRRLLQLSGRGEASLDWSAGSEDRSAERLGDAMAVPSTGIVQGLYMGTMEGASRRAPSLPSWIASDVPTSPLNLWRQDGFCVYLCSFPPWELWTGEKISS